MLSRLFPTQIDNTYRGYTLAIWLLVPIALLKLVMGCNTIVNTAWVIESADHVPLSSYGPGAASMVIFLFRTWGLSLALFSLLALLACVRYRAMVPLAYLMLLIENAGRKVLSAFDPVQITPDNAGLSVSVMINIGFVAALLIGLALSIGASDDT
jgi:hypothetical protein